MMTGQRHKSNKEGLLHLCNPLSDARRLREHLTQEFEIVKGHSGIQLEGPS